jgi:hypothetical protein
MVRSGGRRLVVAFFEHPAAADAAARLLKQRPRTVGPGGTVGVLTGELTGEPRGGLVAPAGLRGRGDDSGVGAVLGGIICALSGRDPPTPDELFGAGSDLSVGDLARFAAELEAGGALVAILARRRGAERAILVLTGCGGRAELHWVVGQAASPGHGRSSPLDHASPGT